MLAVAASAVLGTAAVPGRADARPAQSPPCSCTIPVAREFVATPAALRRYDKVFAAYTRPPIFISYMKAKRQQIKNRVYDWAAEGDFDQGWCKRHARARKAFVVCVTSGFIAYGGVRDAGTSERAAIAAFASSWASSAATVMMYG